jgi:hypothetical protein
VLFSSRMIVEKIAARHGTASNRDRNPVMDAMLP